MAVSRRCVLGHIRRRNGWQTSFLVVVCVCLSPRIVFGAAAKDLFVDVDSLPRPESLADAFKVSLVRPPDEPANSGQKAIINMSAIDMLTGEELEALDAYDALFEKYSLFCNGRWLGAQVLQDSQDLMYVQHIAHMTRPDVILETGTYKGGLTYFLATLLEMADPGGTASQIISVDAHNPDLVFGANWFCPVCADCIRPYTTEVWGRRVQFLQGKAETEAMYEQIIQLLVSMDALVDNGGDISASAAGPGGGPIPAGLRRLTPNPGKVVMVNLDANHEFEGVLRELLFYAPLVTAGSYLVVQDTKLDRIWGTPGPLAALDRFLQLAPEGEFKVEPELKFHAYSQHTYVRRLQESVPFTYFLERALVQSTAAPA